MPSSASRRRDGRPARGELPLDAAGARAREPARAAARRRREGAARRRAPTAPTPVRARRSRRPRPRARAIVARDPRAADGVPLEEMAVLCRTNARLADFEEVFHDAGIPFQGSSLLERDAARRLLRRLERDGGDRRRRRVRDARATRRAGSNALPGQARRARAGAPGRPGAARRARRRARRRRRSRRFVAELRQRFDPGGDGARGVHLLTSTARRASSSTRCSCRGSRRRSCRRSRRARRTELAEERRLLYVGMTRAQRVALADAGRASRARFLAELGPMRREPAATERETARVDAAIARAPARRGGSSAREGRRRPAVRRLPRQRARRRSPRRSRLARRARRRSRASARRSSSATATSARLSPRPIGARSDRLATPSTRREQQVEHAAAGRGGRARRFARSRLSSSSARGSVSGRSRPCADQLLVDAAEPAAVGRVDRDAERRRLAVHRPAGRDDEVGERDQALRVDGLARGRSPTAAASERRSRAAPRCAGSRTRARRRACRGARASAGRAGSSAGGRARRRAAGAARRATVAGSIAQRVEHGSGPARSPRGSTPPSGPGTAGASAARRRSAASRSAGIESGTTTRVAARQPSWCWSQAHS